MPYQYPFWNAPEETQRSFWNSGGSPIAGYPASEWKTDKCGALMQYSKHGDTSSLYGWEIDHIYPKALGGSNSLSNLQPLQWQNNRRKGDSTIWNCD